ncbi:MAG TPA: M28 family peptidase [Gemmatimonas sp.]|uniref:M28 family peptidase n=1 Tax=Gemmatimonas sp. TaxID=1962908 RepID=UPI002ED8423E
MPSFLRITTAAVLTCAPGLLLAQRPAAPSASRPASASSSQAAFVPISKAVHAAIDGERALRTVDYVQRYFRLPGNRGFDFAIDTVASLLRAAGYVREDSAPASARLVYRVESRPMANQAWTPLAASLTIAGRSTPLQQFSTNLNMIAINSGSTPEGGVTAELVDVGTGSEAEFAKASVAGRIVMSTGSARAVFPRAMQAGAIGLLNTQKLPAYNQQEKNTRAIQFTSVPRDTIRQGWTIFISSASYDSLRAALSTSAAQPLRVKAEVRTLFETRPELTVVAEIRGRSRAAERFVYSAHVQEPGANDNASGVGALAEMARVAATLVKSGVSNPQRTVTFLWGDEIRSTDRFLKEDSVRRAGVKWGMSLDMVGENTDLTGGSFLIEKMPDPSAVWVRGEDEHSEWGGKPLAEKDIRAHWFNDFVRQRCLDRARQTQWVVKANPFEGGSDHTPFLNAQIPAVLLWHFTDQFYHTDLDRIGMVSPKSLANVGACALSTGLLLADGSNAIVLAALDELAGVAERTIRAQAALSADTLARGGNADTERHIVDTWRAYYLGAIDRIGDIAVGPANLQAASERAKARVRAAK